MKDRGLEMISLLRDFHVGRNPITWVGHSKGGLFIKQILVHGTWSCVFPRTERGTPDLF